MQQFSIKQIDLITLEGMEVILSRSIGYSTSMADEVDYYKSESPTAWFVAQNTNGENIGFIRRLKQNSEWSLAEFYVEQNCIRRKLIASELLSKFLNANVFEYKHRLRFDLAHFDSDLNSAIEEAGCSEKKQIFHYFEMQIPEEKINISIEEQVTQFDAAEVAEVLSHLHPVKESDAKDWIKSKSIIAIDAESKVVAAAQINFYPDSAEINRIATRAESLRQGYAKQLVLKICNELRDRKIQKLFLKVEDVKVPAISFYRNFGFKENLDKKQVWHSKFF
jgi:ribosomal protein S18 acetylase RimI-like enzyme